MAAAVEFVPAGCQLGWVQYNNIPCLSSFQRCPQKGRHIVLGKYTAAAKPCAGGGGGSGASGVA